MDAAFGRLPTCTSCHSSCIGRPVPQRAVSRPSGAAPSSLHSSKLQCLLGTHRALTACQAASDSPPEASEQQQSTLPQTRNGERYQRELSRVEKNEWRKRSQQMGKDLTVLTVGRAGITSNTLIALGDALSRNELVKVKVGAGCDLDMDQVSDALANGTDSVQVHSVGFTLTLYRDKSLPRPLSSLPKDYRRPGDDGIKPTKQELKQQQRRKRVAEVRRQEQAVIKARPSEYDVVQPSSADRTQASGSQLGAAARLGVAVLAASLAICHVVAPMADAAGNPAILEGIQRLEAGVLQTDGSTPPTTQQRQTSKLQAIQQQLQRIGTLVGIGQYDSARIQLREGPTGRLRKTLRETSDDFVSVSDKMVTTAIGDIEQLDSALKRQQGDKAVALAKQAQADIGAVVDKVAASD